MANYLTLEEIEALQSKIGSALLELCPPGRIDTPPLSEYIPEWASPDKVPKECLPYAARVLSVELDMRKRLGDEVYFMLQTAAGKNQAYFDALIQAEEVTEGLKDGEDTPIAWVHYDTRIFKRALAVTVKEAAKRHEGKAVQSGTQG